MDKKEYWIARSKHVCDHVDMSTLLSNDGIQQVRAGADRQQQYSCPLHGDGRDEGYSARYYPESNSTYCWGCGKARNPVQWVMDRRSFRFGEAILHLEREYHIPSFPGYYEQEQILNRSFEQELVDLIESGPPPWDWKQLEQDLNHVMFAHKGTFPRKKYDVLWSVFDNLQAQDEKAKVPELLIKLQRIFHEQNLRYPTARMARYQTPGSS